MKSRVGQSVAVAALMAGALLAAPAWAQEAAAEASEEEHQALLFGIELTTEYDDNPNLAADTGDPLEAPKEDVVLRVKPSFQIDYPHRDHRFKLDLGGTFKEGMDTALSESNARGRASAELAFANGFELELYDFYLTTRFDQALFFVDVPDLGLAEPGISETDGNTVGASFSYTPKRRLKIDGSYSSTDEHFVFGSPDTPEDDRDRKVFSGTLEIPMSLKWVGYLAADGNDQASAQQAPRNFDERRYVAGLRWERSERVALFVEAGNGQADFDDEEGVEFDNTVWVIGSEIDFSDDSRLELAFGKDLYGNTIYEALLDRTRGQATGLRLLIRKSTQNSFASATLGRIFEATIVGLKWKKFFGERLELVTELRYFNILADEGELMQDDTTSLARVAVEYALVSKWLRLGTFAQLSVRDSVTPANEFENTRAGVYLKLIKKAL